MMLAIIGLILLFIGVMGLLDVDLIEIIKYLLIIPFVIVFGIFFLIIYFIWVIIMLIID